VNSAAPPGTTQQYALRQLREAIVTGELRPGERVVQEDVAERIGVSLAPVREALLVLEQEGQMTYRPRRGYFVTELNTKDLEEIYALRQVLEGMAARSAVTTIDEDTLGRLRSAARACVDAAENGNVGAALEANRRFHFTILEAAGQPHLLRLIQLLWDSTESYRAMYYNMAAERAAAIDAHDRIMSAIRAGDGDGLAAELDEHRTRALEVLRGILKP
jgi:DNA-binding GntR family transcriptional regulator